MKAATPSQTRLSLDALLQRLTEEAAELTTARVGGGTTVAVEVPLR